MASNKTLRNAQKAAIVAANKKYQTSTNDKTKKISITTYNTLPLFVAKMMNVSATEANLLITGGSITVNGVLIFDISNSPVSKNFSK